MFCPACGTGPLAQESRTEEDNPHFFTSMTIFSCAPCRTHWEVSYDSQSMQHVITEVFPEDGEDDEEDTDEEDNEWSEATPHAP